MHTTEEEDFATSWVTETVTGTVPFQAGSLQSLPKAPVTGLQVSLQAWPLLEALHSDIPGSLSSLPGMVTAFSIGLLQEFRLY